MKQILLIMLLLAVPALADSQTQNVVIEVYTQGTLTLTQGRVNDLTAKVNIFPITTPTQDITGVSTTPPAQVTSDHVQFVWNSPQLGNYDYAYTAKTSVHREPVKIYTKVDFPIPLNDIPDQIKKYTKPSEFIDSDNQEIINLADSITGGETDLWKAVSKLGIWVRENIKYSLSTIAAETSQTAGWTLNHKTGVCDEITTLFIAMNRARGIPARFVKGLAYTESKLTENPWNMHGWAEVYFPNYGWVPYDVTFGQFGHIDPYHIEMQKLADPSTTSVEVTWRGQGNVSLGEIEIGGRLVSEKATANKQARITLDAYKQNVGFGSYNLLAAKVENPNPYATTVHMTLAKVKELETEQGQDRTLILKPKEVSYAFWIFRVQEGLEPDKIYTIPLRIVTSFNDTYETFITSQKKELTYSQADVSRQKSLFLDQVRKGASTQKLLKCTAPRSYVYFYEEPTITCTITNPEKYTMRDLNVCLYRKCKTVSILPESSVIVSLKIPKTKPRLEDMSVIARNDKVSQLDSITIDLRDEPKLAFNVFAPKKVSYGEVFDITINAQKTSYSQAKNIHVKITHGNWKREAELDGINSMQITFDSTAMEEKKFKLEATWKDELGREYKGGTEWSTEIGKINWLQKLGRWLSRFFKSIKDTFF